MKQNWFWFLLVMVISPLLVKTKNAGGHMFGFGGNRKYRKAAGKLGVLIHRQILDALFNHEQLFHAPQEVAFTSGYLKSFFWSVLNRQGCNDMTLQHQLLRDTCNKISPDKLWEIYERGIALADPLAKSYQAGCVNAYELGVTAGLNDSEEAAINKVTPENLTRYLLGKGLEGPAFIEEDVVQFMTNSVSTDANLERKSSDGVCVPD
ncbi:MAG: hypothetical protein ACYTBY_10650 [Planctomycetota bacterium]|jgi:hypothetical protein